MPKPTCKEVRVEALSGGQVQLVKYSLQNEFRYTQAETWSVPEDWTDEQIAEFKDELTSKVTEVVENRAQAEQDALLAQSDWYKG